jgi:hypothetical protein
MLGKVLIFLLVFTRAACVLAKHIFIMGDSVDRTMANDLCTIHTEVLKYDDIKQYNWCQHDTNLFPNNLDHEVCQICSYHNTSLATAFFFGSSDMGPYHNQDKLIQNDVLQYHTGKRMRPVYDAYVKQFGHPTQLMLSFAVWDLFGMLWSTGDTGDKLPLKDNVLWKKCVDEYEKNLRIRILQARQILDDTNSAHTELWLRTSPVNAHLQVLLYEVNSITRRLAAEYNCGLFDYDFMIYDKIQFTSFDRTELQHFDDYHHIVHPNLFVDEIHNVPHLSFMGAKILLEETYSKWRIPPLKVEDTTPIYQSGIKVYLIANKDTDMNTYTDLMNNAYLFDHVNNLRHSGLNMKLLELAKLGIGDVYKIKHNWMESIREGAPLEDFSDCSLVRVKYVQNVTLLCSNAPIDCVYGKFRHYFMGLGDAPVQKRLKNLFGINKHIEKKVKPFQNRLLIRRRGLHDSYSNEAKVTHIYTENVCNHHHVPIHLLPIAIYYWSWKEYSNDHLLPLWEFAKFWNEFPENKIFNNGTQVVVKVHEFEYLYIISNGSVTTLSSVDSLTAIGRVPDDVVGITRSQMDRICESFVCQ